MQATEAPPPAVDGLAWSNPRTVKGEANGWIKLTQADVDKIRRLRGEGWSTGKLAHRFGVSRNTICAVLTGKTWTDA